MDKEIIDMIIGVDFASSEDTSVYVEHPISKKLKDENKEIMTPGFYAILPLVTHPIGIVSVKI